MEFSVYLIRLVGFYPHCLEKETLDELQWDARYKFPSGCYALETSLKISPFKGMKINLPNEDDSVEVEDVVVNHHGQTLLFLDRSCFGGSHGKFGEEVWGTEEDIQSMLNHLVPNWIWVGRLYDCYNDIR